jgi:hypothetical protein
LLIKEAYCLIQAFPKVKIFFAFLSLGFFMAACGRRESPKHPEEIIFTYPPEEEGTNTCKMSTTLPETTQ